MGLVPANKATKAVLQIKENGKSISLKKVLEGKKYKIPKISKAGILPHSLISTHKRPKIERFKVGVQ